MADKADPMVELVEEEEEEWPEAGAQNVEEAEQYQDKINNIFDHLSLLIHQDTKTALSQTIQNFKKVVTKQWDSMGAANTDVVLQTIKDLTVLYLRQHLMAGGVEVVDPLKKYHWDSSFYVNYQNGPGGQRRQLLLWTSLVMWARHINTYQKSVQTSQH